MSTWPPPPPEDADEHEAFLSCLGIEDYRPRGYYQPGSAFLAASALGWVPYDSAVSAVRVLLRASYDDLRHRVQQLFRSLNSVFSSESMRPPFAVRWRFPNEDLYVCVDHPPLAPALQAVNRVMTKVAATDAREDACDKFYDAVEKLMGLLVVEGGAGPAVLNQEAFESAFGLEWVLERGFEFGTVAASRPGSIRAVSAETDLKPPKIEF